MSYKKDTTLKQGCSRAEEGKEVFDDNLEIIISLDKIVDSLYIWFHVDLIK